MSFVETTICERRCDQLRVCSAHERLRLIERGATERVGLPAGAVGLTQNSKVGSFRAGLP